MTDTAQEPFDFAQSRDDCDKLLEDLQQMQTTYDARLLAPHLLIRAARIYAALVASNIQNKAELPEIFDTALKEAQMKQEKPRIIYGKNNGQQH